KRFLKSDHLAGSQAARPPYFASAFINQEGTPGVKADSIVFARRIVTLGALCLCVAPALAQQTATARIVQAANTFLSSLDAKQRQHVLYAFDDGEQRARWSNLPTAFVPRGGISLKEMTPEQRSAAMALVAAALSPRGFEKVQQIMEGDEVNKLTDRGPGGNGLPPGGGGNGAPPGGGGNAPPRPNLGNLSAQSNGP